MTTQSNQPEDRSSRMKFWGAAVIMLMMVLMVFSSNIASQFTRGRGAAADVVLGTANGDRKITAADRQYALRMLDVLESMYLLVPNPYTQVAEPVPLTAACWGEALSRDLRQHPEALALLLQESVANGPGASSFALGSLDPTQRSTDAVGLLNSGMINSDDLRPLPGSMLNQILAGRSTFVQLVVPRFDQRSADNHVPNVAPSDLPPAQQESIYAAFRDFLAIQSASSLVADASKVSEPMVDRLIAERATTYTMQVASFDANPKFNATTQPTEQQLQTQLTSYADKVNGSVTRDNPFGFGYRVADRVKLEMISFKRADVRTIVKAEKSDYEWEVAARMEYARDRVKFTANLPTTHPARTAATQPAATQPAFDTFKAEAVDVQIERAVDARCAEIERRLRSTMAADYQAWSIAQARQTTTAPSSMDVIYTSGDYLDRLAAKIQHDYKLLPTVARYNNEFRDAATLGLLGSFSHATWEVPDAVARKLGISMPFVPAPAYATQFARDLMLPSAIPNAGDAVLERYEPSDAVNVEGDEAETFIFRLTATDPNHPATVGADLETLRPRLVFDWRLAEAQKATVAEAEAAAKPLSPTADLQIPNVPVLTTTVGPFGGSSVTPPPVLGLDLRGYAQFADRVNDKLLADPEKTPIAVIDVPLARKVFVVRRTAMHGGWQDAGELAELRLYLRQRLASELDNAALGTSPRDPTADAWISVKRIYERNGWQPTKE